MLMMPSMYRSYVSFRYHPQRADSTKCQRHRHTGRQDLAQKQVARARCKQRRERKHRSRANGRRVVQPLEHQNKIRGEKAA